MCRTAVGRDDAQAVPKVLELDITGFDRFIIAAADTVMSRRNSELVAEIFPGVPLTRELGELDTLLSIDKETYRLRVKAERESQEQPDDHTADAARLCAPDVRLGAADLA